MKKLRQELVRSQVGHFLSKEPVWKAILTGLAGTLFISILMGAALQIAFFVTNRSARPELEKATVSSAYALAVRIHDILVPLIEEQRRIGSLFIYNPSELKSHIELNKLLFDVAIWDGASTAFSNDASFNLRMYANNTQYPAVARDMFQPITKEALHAWVQEASNEGQPHLEISGSIVPQHLRIGQLVSFQPPFVIVSHVRLDVIDQLQSPSPLVLLSQAGNALASWNANGLPSELYREISHVRLDGRPGATRLVSWDGFSGSWIGAAVSVGMDGMVVASASPSSIANFTVLQKTFPVTMILLLGFIVLFGSACGYAGFVGIVDIMPFRSRKIEPHVKRNLVVVYGACRNIGHLLAGEPAVQAHASLSEALRLAEIIMVRYGGVYESHGQSFTAFFGLTELDKTEVWRALRAGLELRRRLSEYNEHRAVTALNPITISTGLHAGVALCARFGLSTQSAIGEAVTGAKALATMAPHYRQDLLVSNIVWQQSDGRFEGELIGEEKIDSFSTQIFSIQAYRDQEGNAIKVPESIQDVSQSIVIEVQVPQKWLVNNGTQIVGPLSKFEISGMLFAQELDFDSQCWAEGTSEARRISRAEIFSGSQDEDSSIWVFDGELIHGPMSPGFLTTALRHGAIAETSYFCEGSTIHGWKPVLLWNMAAA